MWRTLLPWILILAPLGASRSPSQPDPRLADARAGAVTPGPLLIGTLHRARYNSSAYGFKLGGSGGSSRISVIVTRRLAAREGSSGNSGWVSALPDTAKICDGG